MPVLSLCSQRLSGEGLKHRLPENHGIPDEPGFSATSSRGGRPRPHRPPGPAWLARTSPDEATPVPFSDTPADRDWAGPDVQEAVAQACAVFSVSSASQR
jgi:hypothetical protein